VPLQLQNPHSVLAALEKRPEAVIEIRLSSRNPSGAWGKVVELAAQHRIRVVRGGSRREAGGQRQREPSAGSGRNGAAEAIVKEFDDVELEELFANANSRTDGHGLWLALDQIQDPHNVGAIFRSAAFFGVEGIIVTRDRSAPLNRVVYDVASGGVEYLPFSSQANLARTLEQAKKAGVWVLGASEHAETDVAEIQHDRPWLLVLGNEEKGLRRLTRDQCDLLCRLPARGAIKSLNVSVAAGVLMAALTTAKRK